MDSERPNGGPISWMRSALEEWLPPNAADPKRLADWLSGRHLPPVGDDDEPYVWILRGLAQGKDRPRGEQAIAEALATLLEEEIDATSGSRADKLLFNLFKLAAAIGWPDALCEPLHTVLQRATLKDRRWRGAALTDSLRGAIIENQLDARYESMWQSMLTGTPHPYVGGFPVSGFDGILWMPPSAEERGHPALRAIGRALRAIADYINADPELCENRAVEFRSYLARVRNAYPGLYQISDATLLYMAHDEKWPDYALQSLFRLALIVGRPDDSTVIFAVPEAFTTLRRFENIEGVLCDGRVVLLRAHDSEFVAIREQIETEELQRRSMSLGPRLKIKPQAPPSESGSTTGTPNPRRTKRITGEN